jgi:hypothetical protein
MSDSSTENYGATARLNALLAGIAALDSSLQLPVLRQQLEYGLERLQALEQEHYTFLGECAQLAAENVQDIRVRDLEQRLTALENPPEATWGETFLAVVTNIAMQIIVLVAVEALAVVVIAFTAKVVALGAIRSAATKFVPSTTKQELIHSLDSLANSKKVADLAPYALEEIAENVRRGEIPDAGYTILVDANKTRVVKSIDDWHSVSDEVLKRRMELADEFILAKHAVAQNDTDVLKAYADAKTNAGDAAIKKYSSAWRDWVGGEQGGLALTPGYTLLEKLKQVIEDGSRASDETRHTFLTSTVSGRFLSYASNMRLQVAEEYAALRLHVRYTTDSALKNDQQIANLAYMITASLPHFESYRRIAQIVRPWLVTGFEVYYWLDFMRVNGCLDERGGPKIQAGVNYQAGPHHKPGDYIDGFVILGYAGDPPPEPVLDVEGLGAGTRHWLTLYKADLYSGVAVISELQAEYLYHRFAKTYFSNQTNLAAAHLPFVYAETNYQHLSAEQPRLWEGHLTSEERTHRLNEMRLLVIMFFALLPTLNPNPKLDEFLGEGTSLSVQNFLAGGSFGITPDLVDPVTATANALESAREPARALQEALGATSSQQLQNSILFFADMITDLNLDILNYTQQAAAGGDAGPSAKSLDELNQEIEDEKLLLAAAYAEIKTLAQDDPDLLKSIIDRYDASVQGLLAWQQEAQWRWYGAEPVVEE